MNIFGKFINFVTFVPKSVFEASQEGAKFLNNALVKADGNVTVDFKFTGCFGFF